MEKDKVKDKDEVVAATPSSPDTAGAAGTAVGTVAGSASPDVDDDQTLLGTRTGSETSMTRANSAAAAQPDLKSGGSQGVPRPPSMPASGAGAEETGSFGSGSKRVQTRRFSDTSTRTPPASTMRPRYSQPSSPHQMAAGLLPAMPLAAPSLLPGAMVSDPRRLRRASALVGEEPALVYYPDGRSAYAVDWTRSALPLPLSLPTGQWLMAYPDASEAATTAVRDRGTPSSPTPSTAGGSPNPTVSTEPTTLGADQDLDEELDPDRTAR